MGTSKSSPGPGGGSPLVPPWADLDEAGPGPAPDPQRFRSFRIALGKYIGKNDPAYLKTALGHYARTSAGGAGTAARRFAPAAKAGAALLGTIADLAAGGTGEAESGVNLSALAGRDIESVIEAIVEALCPVGSSGDSDAIRIGLSEALAECLEDQDTFDPTALTEEMIIELGLAYIEEEVCLRIILDSGAAFEKLDDPVASIDKENELRQLVRVVVDQCGGPALRRDLKHFNRAKRELTIRDIIREVFVVLEDFQ